MGSLSSFQTEGRRENISWRRRQHATQRGGEKKSKGRAAEFTKVGVVRESIIRSKRMGSRKRAILFRTADTEIQEWVSGWRIGPKNLFQLQGLRSPWWKESIEEAGTRPEIRLFCKNWSTLNLGKILPRKDVFQMKLCQLEFNPPLKLMDDLCQ